MPDWLECIRISIVLGATPGRANRAGGVAAFAAAASRQTGQHMCVRDWKRTLHVMRRHDHQSRVHLSRALAAPRSTAPAPQPRRPDGTELRQRPPTWLRQSTAMRRGAGVRNKVMLLLVRASIAFALAARLSPSAAKAPCVRTRANSCLRLRLEFLSRGVKLSLVCQLSISSGSSPAPMRSEKRRST